MVFIQFLRSRIDGIPSYSGIYCFVLFLLCWFACTPQPFSLESPDQHYRIWIEPENGEVYYTLEYRGVNLISHSALGLLLPDSSNLLHGAWIGSVEFSEQDTVWQPVYGERAQYRDHYQEAVISFKWADQPGRQLQLRVRAFNEGVAFRYESATGLHITQELTEFTLPESTRLWASDRAQSPIHEIELSALQDTVERPLLAQLSDTLFLTLGEAALVDFARMKLARHPEKPSTLVANLAGEVRFDGPFHSPWRTIMAGRSPGEILENNYLLLNLNEPNQIPNTDWIRPGKVIREVTLTTQGGLACVDFAVRHGLQYIEFDAGWYGNEYDEASDASTVTVDPRRSKGPLDLPRVIEYAASKDIGVLLYVNRRALEQQLDQVLPLYQSWGIKGVKYGFVQVGSQEWTSWLHEAVRKAADHQLMVDIHDEYRPTGYSRTYPNLMTQEGIRGDEESPDNTMVLRTLFTRMPAGAGDHTNCYFASRVDEKMGSHASQLAKAVCIYSPWQFLYWYDRPEASPSKTGGAGNNERFIREVPELTFFDQLPTVWDDTRVIDGYPGSHAVIARQSGKTWYVGVLNGAEARQVQLPLDFLEAGVSYEAIIFADDPAVETPTRVRIDTRRVAPDTVIEQRVDAQRGVAMIIRAVE